MRVVGCVTAATLVAVGSRTSRQATGASYRKCYGVILCLARPVGFANRAAGRIGPNVLSSLTAAGVLLAGQHAVSGPNPEEEAWKMKP